MMRLVHDYQVPSICLKEALTRAPTVAAQSMNRCHDLGSRAPEVPALRIHLGYVPLQPDIEHVLQAILPLRY